MAKNLSRFMGSIEDVRSYNWSSGWTSIDFYYKGGNTYLILHKKSNGKIHIHRMNKNNGTVGARTATKNWGNNYAIAKTFHVGTNHYLFRLKQSTNKTVAINHLWSNGTIGGEVFSDNWTGNWTSVSFYYSGTNTYLMHHKKSNGRIHIHKMNTNGTVGTKTDTKNWGNNYTIATTYNVDGKNYLFRLKEKHNGIAKINRLNNYGTLGSEIKSYNWSEGWTIAKFFKTKGRTYLYLYKKGNGEVHVHVMKPDGTVGTRIANYGKKASYAKSYKTGSEANRGPTRRGKWWTSMEFFDVGNNTFWMRLRYTSGQVKINKISPMESVGPMIGHVTPTTAKIWIGIVGNKPSNASLIFRALGPESWKLKRIPIPSNPDYYLSRVITLTKLRSNTFHQIKVIIDGKTLGSGSFRTAPNKNAQTRFKVVATSCMDVKYSRIQNAWRHISNIRPSLHLLVGDNAYSNTTNRGMIWAEHLQQRGVDNFARVVAKTPTYGIWDDHDFGPNNSNGADRERNHRDESMNAFKELFAHPSYGGTKGIYYKFRWGRVEFFMLDARYFRQNPGLTKKMIGTTQMNWLKKGVRNSTAKFKVICNGSCLAQGSGPGEDWMYYPVEAIKLYSLLKNVPGTLVVTGDIHWCRIIRRNTGRGTHPIWELTSSGVGKHPGRKNSDQQGFISMEFDTTAHNEKVIARIHKQNGGVRYPIKVINLADISCERKI